MARLTEVYLLSTPLENDYKHTLYFNSREGQESYFRSKIVHSFPELSYQRKDGFVRVDKDFDELQNVNYLMYKNEKGKTYYAFITEVRYISDGVSWIFFDVDVIQTWYFDYTVKPSFVEREHVSDDTIGLHTVPEGVETGEFITNTHRKDTKLDDYAIVMGVTEKVSIDGVDTGNVKPAKYGGIFSGIRYIAFPIDDLTNITAAIEGYQEGHADAIVCMFIAPRFLLSKNEHFGMGTDQEGNSRFFGGAMYGYDGAVTYDITYQKDYYMDGYTPKNNKLLTFPYNYLLVSNNNGASAIYKYEHFSGSNVEFEVNGVVTPGCSVRMAPKNYNRTSVYDEAGINLGKYPICAWTSDVYTNWLTQNSVNIGVDMVKNVGQVILGAGAIATGAGAGIGAGMATSGLMGIASSVGQIYQMSFTPPQANGNINSGDVITASNKNTFHFYNMSVKREYAEIIDNYFDMFGYKVNRVKTPNIHHRSRYWFTKTIDVNIDGAIPMKDIEKIKDCYNTGITFWRNGNEIGDYSLSNEIKNIV